MLRFVPFRNLNPSETGFPRSVSAACHGEMLFAAIHRASLPSHSPRFLADSGAIADQTGSSAFAVDNRRPKLVKLVGMCGPHDMDSAEPSPIRRVPPHSRLTT